jgi:hypothetical protein
MDVIRVKPVSVMNLLVLTVLTALLLGGCGGVWKDNRTPGVVSMSVNGTAVNPTAAPDPAHPSLTVGPGNAVLGICQAHDPDNDSVTYKWFVQPTPLTTASATPAADADNQQSFLWTALTTEGVYAMSCTITDSRGGITSITAYIRVLNPSNHAPTAVLDPKTATLTPGDPQDFICTGTDLDAADTLTFQFVALKGTFDSPSTTGRIGKARYLSPTTAGDDTVYCVVSDGHGGYAVAAAPVKLVQP